jgi:hypothetical protein
VVGNGLRAEQHAGEDGGVDDGATRPRHPALLAGGGQKCEVERSVVRDDNGIGGEREEVGQHTGDPWRCSHHGVGNPCQLTDVLWYRHARINERGEFGYWPPGAEPDSANLGDARFVGEPAGRLDIDDDEIAWRQERARWQEARQQPPVPPVAVTALTQLWLIRRVSVLGP